jgi:hypothetical protein
MIDFVGPLASDYKHGGVMKKPTIDPFYTLRDLVEMGVFGTKSVRHLRRVAQHQRIDPRTYESKFEMSLAAAHSYPKFTTEGGRWGLYASQIEEHRMRKQGISR